MRKSALFTIILLSILFLSGIRVSAQEMTEPTPIRPVYSIYSIEIGSSHLADTYLTPSKYAGWHAGFEYERLQAMKFSPDNQVMQMKIGINLDKTLNRLKNHTMWNATLDFSWGMMYRKKLLSGLSGGIGGAAAMRLGCLYLHRGGNNPASAKASLTLGLTGYLTWNGKLGRLPVTLRYQPSIPVVGAYFAPDYGELYYEIYLGNHKGLAHCAWWGNYLETEQTVTADLHFGATTLRIGYSGNFYNTNINHTVTRMSSHSAIIGVGGEWLSINPAKRLSDKAAIISATY